MVVAGPVCDRLPSAHVVGWTFEVLPAGVPWVAIAERTAMAT